MEFTQKNYGSNIMQAINDFVVEQGIRFLTDYLLVDIYYKTNYPEHNLIRCKTQLQLLDLMNRKEVELIKIVEKY